MSGPRNTDDTREHVPVRPTQVIGSARAQAFRFALDHGSYPLHDAPPREVALHAPASVFAHAPPLFRVLEQLRDRLRKIQDIALTCQEAGSTVDDRLPAAASRRRP